MHRIIAFSIVWLCAHVVYADTSIRTIVRDVVTSDGKAFLTFYYRGKTLLLDRLEISQSNGSKQIYEQIYFDQNVVFARFCGANSENQKIIGSDNVDVVISRYPNDVYPHMLTIRHKDGRSELFELEGSIYVPLSREEAAKRNIGIISKFSVSNADQIRKSVIDSMKTEQDAAANP